MKNRQRTKKNKNTEENAVRTHIDGGLASDHNQLGGGVGLLHTRGANAMPLHVE